MAEQPPSTLPANFFDKQGSGSPPATLPPDFKFEDDKPQQGNAVTRFVQGTGIPAAVDQYTKPAADSTSPVFDRIRNVVGYLSGAPSTDNLKNAWDMVKGIGESTIDHVKKADEAGKNGDFAAALGHSLAAIPGIGAAGADIKDKIDKGDYAGAAGGLSMFLLPAGEGGLNKISNAVADTGAKVIPRIAPGARAVATDVAMKALDRIPFAKAAVPIIESFREPQPSYTPPTASGTPGTTQVPSRLVQPVEYGSGTGHFGEEVTPQAPLAPQQARPDPLWMKATEPQPQQSLLDVMQSDPAQVMADRLAARQRPAAIAPRAERPAPAWTEGPGPGSDPRTFTTEQMNAEMTPEQFQQALSERAGAMRNRNVTGVLDRLKAMSQEPAPVPRETPEIASSPAPSPEASSGATPEFEPIPNDNPTSLGAALRDPAAVQAEVAKRGSAASRNALREAKVQKVVDHLKAKEFDAGSVQLISPRQWSAVAQSAGVNDLSAAQIDLIKKQFPKE